MMVTNWSLFETLHRVPILPGKPGILSFSFPGLQIAQKVVKSWNFNSIPGKKLEISKFYISSFTFQDVIYKNNSDLLYLHYQLTDSKSNWPWISLFLPGNNLENTWNFVSQEKWEPCISFFNTFRTFITKICMKVPWTWHKKPWI